MYEDEIDFERISQEMIIENDDIDCDITDFFTLEEQHESICDVLRFLNYKDKDMVYLSFLSKKRQVDLAKILDKTQPAVCYNIKRIKTQVEFVYYFLTKIDYFFTFLQSEENELTAHECDILLVLFYCSSITKTSSVIGFHQITCRNKLASVFEYLEKNNPDIMDVLDYIMLKFNKIKRSIYKQNN